MSDPNLLTRINEASAKIAALHKERDELEVVANDFHAKSTAAIARRFQCKKEIEEWTAALNSLGVVQRVQTAEQAAVAAKASAEANEKKATASLADIEKMKAELAAMISEAKAAEKPAEPPK